jgi:CHAT domain-containing protein/tetratricopeptide (TPR) repeat protein
MNDRKIWPYVRYRKLFTLYLALLAVMVDEVALAQPAEKPTRRIAEQAPAKLPLTPGQQRRLDETDVANRELMQLYQQGQFAEAITLAKKVVALRTEILGEDDPQTAEGINNLAALHESQGDYAQAATLLEKALAIRKRTLGANHPHVAVSLNNLATVYQARGEYARALPLHEQALGIDKQTLGENHPQTAMDMSNLARLYQLRGDYAQALELCERVVRIMKESLGEVHPHTATSLNNLAEVYLSQGDYAQARPLHEQSLAVRKRILGENHPDTAVSLGNLAELYRLQGEYDRALPLYEQALQIQQRVLGPNHPYTAGTLNNMALLYESQGDLTRALSVCEQALEITSRALGEIHPETATCLENLAGLHRAQSDYSRAKSLLEQALAVSTQSLGENHPNTASTLRGLAGLYLAQRDYVRALPLYERALAIRKRALGENNADTATSLDNLGLLYQIQGDFARALPLHKRALAIRRKVLGENHPSTLVSLSNLAGLYHSQQDYTRATPLLERVLATRRNALGNRHPDVANTLNNLGGIYDSQGNYTKALPLFQDALGILSEHIEALAAAQSERQQLAMAETGRRYLNNVVSCSLQISEGVDGTYASVLRWKGIVFARQQWGRQRRGTDATDEVRKLQEELRQVSGRLATLALATPSPEQSVAWRRQLVELTDSKERLEVLLSGLSGEPRRLSGEKELTPEKLRKLIPIGAALIDLLEYARYTKPKEGVPANDRWERRVAAFVVREDQPVGAIDLGPAEPIYAAIAEWRGQIVQWAHTPLGAAEELRRLIWQPLEAHVKDCSTVLISPDGTLAWVPWGALPGERPGSYLLEERAIAVVPVPQLIPSLLKSSPDDAAEPTLLVVGDVEYGAPPGQATLLAHSRSAARGTSGRSGLRGAWSPLPATRPEIAEIKSTFRRAFRPAEEQELGAADATEEAVRDQAPRYRFLHLATHGFFAPPEVLSVLGTSAMRGLSLGQSDLFGERGVVGFHPGLLSGIVLAGANLPPRPEQDDGILTSIEVAALDLRDVELVTLSACETGLGATAGGEGLLGLQRAFQIAGAGTTVASLWKVNDDATRALMSEFYNNIWERKLPRIEALRQAQIAMLHRYDVKSRTLRGPGGTVPLDVEKLAEARERGSEVPAARTPPLYWAAFILSGDWR